MAADPSKLSYVSLPGEVRNKIMDLVLVHGDLYPSKPVPRTSSLLPPLPPTYSTQPGIQLIATCKQAYQEGHALFYSSNKFHFPCLDTFEWSDKLQAKHKAMIKRVSITVGLDELTPSMIDEIKQSLPDCAWEDADPFLSEAVVDTLTEAWESKMRHMAAWTSLEEIELFSFYKKYPLQHREVVANLTEISQWSQSLYWRNAFQWPQTCVSKSIKAKLERVGWKNAIEWLYMRGAGELAEGFYLGAVMIPEGWRMDGRGWYAW